MSDMFPWFDLKLSIAFFAITVLAATPGCRKGHRQNSAEPSGAETTMLSEESAMGGRPPIGGAFQDKELLPVGVDDDHLACWS